MTARDTDARADARLETHRFYSVLIKGVQGGRRRGRQRGDLPRAAAGRHHARARASPRTRPRDIFTRGEALQTIDMNQCGYFEEALKMRNLLCEFRAHPDRPQPPTILGFREHIFTGHLEAALVARSYMALQEGCFVTLTQRVLWDPLPGAAALWPPRCLRQDLLDDARRRLQGLEGHQPLRGHLRRLQPPAARRTIPYVEYVQVGKGATSACSRSTSSRRSSRRATPSSASRAMSTASASSSTSCGFSLLLLGPGFYFNNACTVFAMFVFLYLQLWSHTLQLDVGVPCRRPAQRAVGAAARPAAHRAHPVLPRRRARHHALDHQVPRDLLTGSPFFFMFHMGTKAHYYDGTLKYGGAKYRPTGRGFVMQHEEFAELYRFHAGSHLYNGFELLWGLLLLMQLGSWPLGMGTYWRTCWSLWAVMVSWLFAPFWFNPLAFDPEKLKEDVRGWLMWMRRKEANPLLSWEAWYEEGTRTRRPNRQAAWSRRACATSSFIGLVASSPAARPARARLKPGLVVGGVVGAVLFLFVVRYVLVTSRSHLALRVGSTSSHRRYRRRRPRVPRRSPSTRSSSWPRRAATCAPPDADPDGPQQAALVHPLHAGLRLSLRRAAARAVLPALAAALLPSAADEIAPLGCLRTSRGSHRDHAHARRGLVRRLVRRRMSSSGSRAALASIGARAFPPDGAGEGSHDVLAMEQGQQTGMGSLPYGVVFCR